MITPQGRPPKYHPGYNPVEFFTDSTNKNKLGFRYVYQVFSANTSVQLVSDLKIAPRPVDGIGYVDISAHLQNYLKGFKNIESTTFSSADNGSIVNYDLKVGESYMVEESFYDYNFFSGNTGLLFSTAHPFIVGDQIKVQLDNVTGDFRDGLNGYYTIINIPNPSAVTLNFPWIGNGPATPGKVTYADERKGVFLNLYNFSGMVSTNESMNVGKFYDFQEAWNNTPNFLLSNANSKFLANFPRANYNVTPSQFLAIQAFDNKANSVRYINFSNSNGDFFRKDANSNASWIKQIPIGPGNHGTLTTLGGTAPLIKPTTTWYEVWTTSAFNSVTSERIRINIDNRCVINNVQIYFMDRAGSWGSFAFQNKIFKNVNVDRETFNKRFGTNNPSKGFVFKTYDEGETTIQSTVEEEYTLNTNWMSDEMSVYWEEMFTSPYTYVKWTDGKWYSVKIKDNSDDIPRKRNQSMIKKSVKIKFSIKNRVNF